jgi:hypothetical protein
MRHAHPKFIMQSQTAASFNIYGSMHCKSVPIYIQQDATLHSLFISGDCSTCFGWYYHPTSGAQTTVSTASGICHTVTAAVWQIPDAVDTVVYAPDDGWRYHPKHVEQSPDINKLCSIASSWIYVGIMLLLSKPLCYLWNRHLNFDQPCGFRFILLVNHVKFYSICKR